MEIKDITTLKPAPYNPRIMSSHDAASLERSITKFGDISGITKSVNTGHIITGNQRVNTLIKKFGAERVKIEITNTQEADEYGTVATGYVFVEGTNIKLNYREMLCSLEIEKTVCITANRVEAEWDVDQLAEINHELAQLENGSVYLELTGQTEDEIERLLKATGAIEDQPEKPANFDLSFTLTESQREVIDEALGHIKATHTIVSDDNKSMNGGALYYICRDYLDRLHGSQEQVTEPQNPAPKLAEGGMVDSTDPILVGNGDHESFIPATINPDEPSPEPQPIPES